MNKELIKKYKPEFEHWLKDGKILFKHKHSIAWWADDCWNCSSDYVQAIIINDEYVEFRKALSEGKTIQYYVDGFAGWQDVKSLNQSCMHPTSFRIKPEEPKFKAGDWVRDIRPGIKKPIVQLQPNCIALTNYEEDGKHYEKWTPRLGEWCWFWDEHYTTAILAKFENISDGLFVEHHGNIFEYCEPFIGQLPSNLKG